MAGDLWKGAGKMENGCLVIVAAFNNYQVKEKDIACNISYLKFGLLL